MDDLLIKRKKGVFSYPEVNFSAETGICNLIGESYLEDTVEFYSHLINWLQKYMETGKPMTFNFYIIYFNTSSSRSILDILFLLKEYKDSGKDLEANWFYQKVNKQMLEEEIEDFEDEAEIEINFKQMPEDFEI